MRKILLLVLLFSLSNLQAEENALPEESSQEILSKNINIEEPVVLDELVQEELVRKAIEREELDADKLVEQLVEMVNEYNKSSRPGVPAYSPGTLIGPDCDLTPIANLLGTIASSIGRVTDGTSLRSTVLGILGDPNSVLGTDYTVVQALKEIIDFLDSEHTITNANTPYVISAPGKYKVIENISKDFSGDNAIEIQSNNVTLDLNGYSITNTVSFSNTAVNVFSGYRNIIVKNGSLIGFGNGFYSSNNDNIKLISLSCKSNVIGIRMYYIDELLIDDCMCDYNTSCGCLASSFQNIRIKNSIFNNVTGTGGSYVCTGLCLNIGTDAIVENCIANKNLHSQSNRSSVGFQIQDSRSITYLNCEASFNGRDDNTTQGYGFSINEQGVALEDVQNVILKNCVANNNYGYGIPPAAHLNAGGIGFKYVGNVVTEVVPILMQNCIANNNTQHGVYIIEANKGHIENCQFINNGQYGVSIDSTVSDLYFLNNKFINNGSLAANAIPANINNAGTRNVFLSNTAFMNLVAVPAGPGLNYVDTGASSGLSTSAWSLAGLAPIPTWPIDNLNIIP